MYTSLKWSEEAIVAYSLARNDLVGRPDTLEQKQQMLWFRSWLSRKFLLSLDARKPLSIAFFRMWAVRGDGTGRQSISHTPGLRVGFSAAPGHPHLFRGFRFACAVSLRGSSQLSSRQRSWPALAQQSGPRAPKRARSWSCHVQRKAIVHLKAALSAPSIRIRL
jgi:hypothetical protein